MEFGLSLSNFLLQMENTCLHFVRFGSNGNIGKWKGEAPPWISLSHVSVYLTLVAKKNMWDLSDHVGTLFRGFLCYLL